MPIFDQEDRKMNEFDLVWPDPIPPEVDLTDLDALDEWASS